MPATIALVIADMQRHRLGGPSRLGSLVAGRSVLAHTLARVARVPAVQAIAVVHPAGQDFQPLLRDLALPKPLHLHADEQGLADVHTLSRQAARRWAPDAWRGGLGGAVCYDELLPAAPWLAAMQTLDAASALVVGGDWMLVDPTLCAGVLDLHLQQPDALQMTFCQAPPGLSGVAVGRTFIEQLAQKQAGIGQLLAYVPSRPQADPIGRDVCFAIDPAVRSCTCRWVYDLPIAAARIDAVAQQLGSSLPDADSRAVVATWSALEPTQPPARPREVTLELTPRRPAHGLIVPQHHVSLNRPDMPLDLALNLVRQVGAMQDVLLTLGGLGDALLHEHWEAIVQAAHDASVPGITLETDLRCPPQTWQRLLELPLDVLVVRVNADTAAVYERTMAPGEPEAFRGVVEALQTLITRRHAAIAGSTRPWLPWIVPSLVKTADTLADMETFFDRWTHFAGHAVIAPATTGVGLMPAQSPVVMASPRRRPCRQVPQRMTVLSDGTVARCDQDWLARAPAGDATKQTLLEVWQALAKVRDAHRTGQWATLDLCGSCTEWHRP